MIEQGIKLNKIEKMFFSSRKKGKKTIASFGTKQ